LPTFKDNIDYYNWVGFYFANQESKTLHLGPYVGAETDLLSSLSGKGFADRCGFNENFVVPDVAAQDNYIAWLYSEVRNCGSSFCRKTLGK
jgi:GAF domain-containing protein